MKFLRKLLVSALLIISLVTLTGCFPANVKEAKQKLEGLNYFCVDGDYAGNEDGIVSGFTASKFDENNQKQTIIVLYFESSSKAEKYAKSWYNSIFITEYNGKCAYSGTEKAVNDFRS